MLIMERTSEVVMDCGSCGGHAAVLTNRVLEFLNRFLNYDS